MDSNRAIQDINAMPVKLYYRNYSKPEDENKAEPIETVYRTTDRATLKYLKNHDPNIPYSINTVHLQDPYKHPLRLEGYATADIFKVRPASFKIMYRSKDTTLRSRHSKNAHAKRESPLMHYDNDDDKSISKSENQRCIRITNIMKQYCTNSTLHGLRYIGDSNLSIVERIFWVISFTLAVLTAAYYIWFLYRKWVSTPIIIALSPESVSLDQFPFPSVTICNMNNVKKSEAVRINAGNDIRKKLLLEDMCRLESMSPRSFNESTITWDNVLRFMINVSQSCTDMLHLCKWHGNVTDCEKIFNPTMTDEGMCCNFNSVDRKYLFYNPRDWSDINMTFPFNNIDWNPETGYDENVPPDSIPWRPYGAGQYYGLTLVLDVDVDEYYCSSTASVGFKMLLHNPVETPKIAEFAFTVTPGEETRVIIAPRILSASKSIISVPLKKRKCFFTSERKLRYYRTYTQKNCILECEANFTQKICHCVQYYMPKSSNTLICEKKDDTCAMKARRAMEVKLYDDDIGIALNVSETPSCNCYPGCFEIGYNVEISQSKLVSSFIVPDSYVKKSKEYFSTNMAVVHLFFVDSQFTKYMKNELFGFTEFLSNTGGLLGLFMGFSFLSLVEIMYFATLRFWCRIYKKRHVSRDNTLHVQPFDSNTNLVYPFVQ
ncbi:pickpocket protein 28 [Bombus vancouverensis nearcticus]|uniref:Pickpocket protein 28 isoform X1 n=2 Tax=Bombus bifarius TaxID=103933 RepID=A0A6P8MB69_9HYME|nr:pickpocket protein 28 isoform X1 [Bombus vancouverensis nearcticus]XP_033190867.1 pickpocket protein 28 isoform X1 [Bombus vancouverensis nearcticus]XP_033299895.1 pickpocket protein 28 isoform X1 [Bombus bifarius]XP_033299898.1 pickpocket protein 28 isoform X1 [Bombus bifarius]